MDNNEIIEQHLVVNNLTTRTNQSDIKPLDIITPDRVMFWGIIGFALCWVAIFIMLSKKVRITHKEIAVNIKSLHQIPCKSCEFYSNDPHLKCAVNPSIVLTEKAVNCSDFSTK